MVKKNKIITGVFLVLLGCFFSCSKKKELNMEAYAQWVENTDNGLCIKKDIQEFEFKLIYKPIDYILDYEYKNDAIKKDSILNRRKELNGYQYITFKIKSTSGKEIMSEGITVENEYYERLEYFIDAVKDDFTLIDGKDTLPCRVYHFERSYGLSPYNTMVMCFEDPDTNEINNNDKTFLYDDKVLGVGKIAMKISGNDLDNLPTLKFN
jgi:hypothetical protein